MSSAQAAVALDRTRAIITGDDKSISLNISNENKQLPYLAQGWIENAQGEKSQTRLRYYRPCNVLNPALKAK